MPRNPLVVVLAGPNGAGKTTSAERLLRGALAVEEFVNADAIAGGLSAYHPESAAVAAGRIMLDRLRFLADRRSDFAFETTLSGRGHARWLAGLRTSGYRVSLLFLSLPDADLAVARVADRVRLGGHRVPEAVVRRRFMAGLRNLFHHYLALVDQGQLYDNSQTDGAHLIASWTKNGKPEIIDPPAWHRLKELAS